MIFNRSLHPDDYTTPQLARRISSLREFIDSSLKGVYCRMDHEHRMWEYANILYQLNELDVPRSASIHDAGYGGSILPTYLNYQCGYGNVTVSDSMTYGDCTAFMASQCNKLAIPLLPQEITSVENLTFVMGEEVFDVTMCISVIEHVHQDLFVPALCELALATKIGGYVMITSDFFRNLEQADLSPFRGIQHTIFTPEFSLMIPLLSKDLLEFVGPIDFDYRGDFVNNYSFVNMCLKRVK